jgi:hypothetical protein
MAYSVANEFRLVEYGDEWEDTRPIAGAHRKLEQKLSLRFSMSWITTQVSRHWVETSRRTLSRIRDVMIGWELFQIDEKEWYSVPVTDKERNPDGISMYDQKVKPLLFHSIDLERLLVVYQHIEAILHERIRRAKAAGEKVTGEMPKHKGVFVRRLFEWLRLLPYRTSIIRDDHPEAQAETYEERKAIWDDVQAERLNQAHQDLVRAKATEQECVQMADSPGFVQTALEEATKLRDRASKVLKWIGMYDGWEPRADAGELRLRGASDG